MSHPERTPGAGPFPTRRSHEDRWAELARAIAARRETVTEQGPPPGERPRTPGELTVIGSGIEAVGFTTYDEALIREADQVFYCVADPATSVWIKTERPDAYDLYVLYHDTKIRYLTYMQMTEAMLHYVREGQRVAAVFYGHPGIFVLSTHRAVAIARREGHRAVLRPAVSALDTLCADLGVDPSQPGMQTFEATDMLIRRRRIDPGLHLVLWQVGLIGELGYQRGGYVNSDLAVLLDYLEETYGPEHTVVNYTGARYPGAKPVNDRHTLASLRSPAAQRTVTGVSTWYVPPAVATPTDPEMLKRLGLLKPGQTVKAPSGPLREIDHYGPRELRAFDDFRDFHVPAAYHWQEDTPAARFLLALREDGNLRQRYAADPSAAVRDWEAPPPRGAAGLSGREQALLARRDGGAMQVAAKGLRAQPDPNAEKVLRHVLTKKTEARSLLRAVRRPVPEGKKAALAEWQHRHDHPEVDWSRMRSELDAVLAGALYPWSGLYLAPQHKIDLYILGRSTDPPSHRVYLNGKALNNVRYSNGMLKWEADGGNAWGGQLATDVSKFWTRRVIGKLWPADQTSGQAHSLGLVEHRLSRGLTLPMLAGTYRTYHGSRHLMVTVSPVPDQISGGLRMGVEIDGQPTQGDVAIGGSSFTVDEVTVPFRTEVPNTGVPPHLQGGYRLRIAGDGHAICADVQITADSIEWGNGNSQKLDTEDGLRISWTKGPEEVPHAQTTLVLDPITLRPMLFGTGTTANASPLALVGMVPVPPEDTAPLVAGPQHGIPDWAWKHLATLAAETSRKGGLFLYHSWEKAATNTRTLRRALWEAGL